MSFRGIASVIVVLGLALLVSLPDLSAYGARLALSPDHVGKAWAPGVVFWAGQINMRFWRYEQGGRLLEQGLHAFPNAFWRQKGCFYVALCHERSGQEPDALRGYESFLRRYPGHPWAHQARHRLTLLRADE